MSTMQKKIIVYALLNDYHCDIIIENADLEPSSLCQLENEKIVIATNRTLVVVFKRDISFFLNYK